jgi:hypothetical protein
MGGRGAAAISRESRGHRAADYWTRCARRGIRAASGKDRREGGGDLNNRSGQRSAVPPPLSEESHLDSTQFQLGMTEKGSRQGERPWV